MLAVGDRLELWLLAHGNSWNPLLPQNFLAGVACARNPPSRDSADTHVVVGIEVVVGAKLVPTAAGWETASTMRGVGQWNLAVGRSVGVSVMHSGAVSRLDLHISLTLFMLLAAFQSASPCWVGESVDHAVRHAAALAAGASMGGHALRLSIARLWVRWAEKAIAEIVFVYPALAVALSLSVMWGCDHAVDADLPLVGQCAHEEERVAASVLLRASVRLLEQDGTYRQEVWVLFSPQFGDEMIGVEAGSAGILLMVVGQVRMPLSLFVSVNCAPDRHSFH